MSDFTDAIEANWLGWSIHPDASDDEGGPGGSQCGSCGSTLAGMRYDAHAIDHSPGEVDQDPIELSICVDCLCYHANGDEPENWEG